MPIMKSFTHKQQQQKNIYPILSCRWLGISLKKVQAWVDPFNKREQNKLESEWFWGRELICSSVKDITIQIFEQLFFCHLKVADLISTTALPPSTFPSLLGRVFFVASKLFGWWGEWCFYPSSLWIPPPPPFHFLPRPTPSSVRRRREAAAAAIWSLMPQWGLLGTLSPHAEASWDSYCTTTTTALQLASQSVRQATDRLNMEI